MSSVTEKKGEGGAPDARDGWFKVTDMVEVNIKVTAVMPVHFTPQPLPWLCPSLTSQMQKMECHEAKLLSASICSIHQTLPGFITFLPIPFTFQRSGSTVEISLWLC